MRVLEYKVSFTTPAFLGNAEQQAQWRTPPFKALLRQWWRVAYSADQTGRLDVARLRAAEGRLFGVAADGGDSRKSQIRIRLERWSIGRLTSWGTLDSERVAHPEVKSRDGRPAPVGAQLYLGYGPLEFAGGQTSLKARAAIQAGEVAKLSMAFPLESEAHRLDIALLLMHHYGTLGGRSRNGWGSFSLTPANLNTPVLDGALDDSLTVPWQKALELDWPHAIGRDARGPLIWQTAPLDDWKSAMRRLAEIKIGLRTQFKFTTGRDAAQPEARHWLSYPVTNHTVREWGNNARLPNSLRFKVRVERNGKLRGVIFHVPCLPPPRFRPDREVVMGVWTRVHEFLGHPAQALQRISS